MYDIIFSSLCHNNDQTLAVYYGEQSIKYMIQYFTINHTFQTGK
jgi:hypothetical protein